MVEGGGGMAFPVVLFDGEREINVGNVRMYPTLDFKTFQMMLSQKIGVSPNQITIYLASNEKKRFSSSPETRWKIPITGKANFAVLAREKDCFILAVLRRSRSRRKHKTRETGFEFEDSLSEKNWSTSPASPMREKLLLLRRHQPDSNDLQYSGFSMPYYNQISQSEILNFNNRLQNLRIQRENHEMAMSRLGLEMDTRGSLDLNLFSNHFQTSNLPSSATANSYPALCIDCTNSKKSDKTVPFHHCLNDPVVVRFRTTAGPIGPRSCGPFL